MMPSQESCHSRLAAPGSTLRPETSNLQSPRPRTETLKNMWLLEQDLGQACRDHEWSVSLKPTVLSGSHVIELIN